MHAHLFNRESTASSSPKAFTQMADFISHPETQVTHTSHAGRAHVTYHVSLNLCAGNVGRMRLGYTKNARQYLVNNTYCSIK